MSKLTRGMCKKRLLRLTCPFHSPTHPDQNQEAAMDAWERIKRKLNIPINLHISAGDYGTVARAEIANFIDNV